MKSLFLGLLASLMLGACATNDTPRAGTGGSTFEIRGKRYDEVWKAVVLTAGRSLIITESNKDAGILRAEKGVGLATWGEVVGVFVRPTTAEAAVYTVEVQSLKRSMVQLTGQDWATTLVSGIKAELDH